MKLKLIIIVDLLIFLLLNLIMIFLITNATNPLKKPLTGIFLIIWIAYLFKKYYQYQPKSKIKSIQLLNEQEEVVKEWQIHQEQGLLIGKNFQDQLVDLDLSEADYAVLISHQHATINRVKGEWFLEDLGNRNGTGVKAAKATTVKRLAAQEVVLINPGDKIFIAKTVLRLIGKT